MGADQPGPLRRWTRAFLTLVADRCPWHPCCKPGCKLRHARDQQLDLTDVR